MVLSQSYQPCQHLKEFRAKSGPHPFKLVSKVVRPGPANRTSIQREEHEIPRCAVCGKAQGRLYACLSCAAIGCCEHEQPHVKEHATAQPGHHLAVDVDRVELFCAVCNDQVYDAEFDQAVLCTLASARSVQGAGKLPDATGEEGTRNGLAARKRKRVAEAEYKPWVATEEEQQKLLVGATPLLERGGIPLGLRGLNNLGNTCFMNSVLQALLHTPPLRNYFLADSHNRGMCQRGRGPHLCLGCDMDAIFSAAFSGSRTPYSPAQFLYSWWRHAENLAGYEQQDAHEFFISTVDGIHANASAAPSAARSSEDGAGDAECRCIVHRVFAGQLRSDVTCTVCGFTSTTHDPCVDISLDLEADSERASQPAPALPNGRHAAPDPSRGESAAAARPPAAARGIPPLRAAGGERRRESGGGQGEAAGGAKASGCATPHSGTATLTGCLERFTRQERLGTSEKFFCQRCGTRQESVKQMSVRRLPLVLCLHLKRFEHSSTRKTSRKLGLHVHFPIHLDMAPYLSSTVVRLRHGNRLMPMPMAPCEAEAEVGPPEAVAGESQAANGASSPCEAPTQHSGESSSVHCAEGAPSCPYELFALVTHAGKLDMGHYVSFLRLEGRWYKCDDAWVTRVDEATVRSAQVYMLYYVRKKLAYRARDAACQRAAEGMGGTDGAETSGQGPGMGDGPTVSSSQVNGV